ncbi:MAG: sugar ABC transporter permease [Candidatus Caldatribacterium sp.]|nr:sugar ABC transporter permease [Candidatus Caldatribacterium sp.]
MPRSSWAKIIRSVFRNRQARAGYLFVLPSILVLSVFVIWPIIQAVWLSLHDWNPLIPEHPFIGLSNYRQLFADSRFWNALWNTLYYTLGVVPARVVFSLFLAVILTQKLRGTTFFRAVYFLPAIGSFAILAIAWKFLMDPDIGIISYYSRLLHLPSSEWLRSTTWAMPAVILVGIWKWLGFTMVILIAALQGIPESLYDAAKVDGAGPWQCFRYITLPMLRPALLFVVADSIISSFQVFDQVYVMTGGGPLFSTETLVLYTYYQGFEFFNMDYASSIAWILFLLVFGVTFLQLRYFRFREAY